MALNFKELRKKNFIKFLWVACGGFWAISISPILRSSWAGDDWPNGQTPYWIEWRSGTLSFFGVMEDAIYWSRAWALGQGRFYPFSYIENRLQFSYLQELWQFKTFQFSLLLLCGFLFVFLIFRLSKSHSLSVITLLALSLTTQFRPGFDPHLGFSSLLSSMLIKVFIAAIIINYVGTNLNKITSLKFSYYSAFIYFAAMATYEFAFLLFPLLVIAFKLGVEDIKSINDYSKNTYKKKSIINWLDQALILVFHKKFRPVLYSWVFYALLVFGFLRQIAKDISGSYILGFSYKSIKVFFSQILTGLPLLTFNTKDFNIFRSDYLKIYVITFIVLSTALFIFFRIRTDSNLGFIPSKINFAKPLYLISFILISCPAAILSLQTTWWDRASISNTYLGVMVTEFGTALFLALVVNNVITKTVFQSKTKI